MKSIPKKNIKMLKHEGKPKKTETKFASKKKPVKLSTAKYIQKRNKEIAGRI